jgi:hypothetical protein
LSQNSKFLYNKFGDRFYSLTDVFSVSATRRNETFLRIFTAAKKIVNLADTNFQAFRISDQSFAAKKLLFLPLSPKPKSVWGQA